MTRLIFPLLTFALLLAPGLAGAFSLSPYPLPQVDGQDLPLILVQSTGGGDYGGCTSRDCGEPQAERSDPALPPPPPGVPADAIGISPEATLLIIKLLDDSNQYCQEHYEKYYIIDCIARAYQRIGGSLPYRSGYGGMRNAILQAGNALHELAIANTDKTRKAKVGPTGRRAGRNDLMRPVDPTPQVRAEAADIIEGSRLVLLRSAAGSDQRRVAYEQVANVVGSTVVLLRSGRRKRRAKDRHLPLLAAFRALILRPARQGPA